MRFVEVNGARVSAIGVGTWQFGSKEWGYGSDYARTTAVDIVRRALDLGVNLLDTAEIYGMGQSERIVGRAIAKRRGEVFLATKLFPVMPLPPIIEWRAVESAGRLRVKAIDLYQVHWPNPLVPNGPTMRGMRRLQQVGLVRHVGVSNFSLLRWRTAERLLGGPVLSNQVQYSLAAAQARPRPRALRAGQRPARDRVQPAGPGPARRSLRHRPPAPAGGAQQQPALPRRQPGARPRVWSTRCARSRLAHDATPAQVALAWLIRKPNVVAIPGASSVAQLEANVAAADLDLTDDEDAQLTDESDRFAPVRGVAAVPGLLQARRQASAAKKAQEEVVEEELLTD